MAVEQLAWNELFSSGVVVCWETVPTLPRPGWVEQRAAGRACVARALAELGVPGRQVGTGSLGQPVWPDGVVGSITHGAGVAAAALSTAPTIRALGIDVEGLRPLRPGVAHRVCAPEEVSALVEAIESGPRIRDLEPRATAVDVAAIVAFSAKESLYKASSVLVHRPRVGFRDVAVTMVGTHLAISPASPGGRLLLAELGPVRAAWQCRGTLIATGVTVEAPQPFQVSELAEAT